MCSNVPPYRVSFNHYLKSRLMTDSFESSTSNYFCSHSQSQRTLLIRRSGLILLWFTNIAFNVVIFLCTFKRALAIRRFSDAKTLLHNIILTDGKLTRITLLQTLVTFPKALDTLRMNTILVRVVSSLLSHIVLSCSPKSST